MAINIQGHPVREAAQKVFPLMLDTNKLRALRNSKADPNSLVPVGTDEVAFISDDVRHYLLKKRIEQQFRLETKSNLASASGGFGAGYVGSNGKNVVGAAHGLEEMIKQAEIANRKFTDEGQSGNYQLPKLSDFSDYEAPGSAAAAAKANASHSNPQQQGAASVDLLDFSAGVSQPQAAAPEIDLLGGFGDVGGGGSSGGAAIDIFGAPSDQITINLNPSPALAVGGGGLLDFGAATAGVDPFAGLSGGGGMGGATGDLLGTTSTSDQGVGSLLDFGGMSNDPSHDPLAHAGGLLDVGKPTSGNDAMGGIPNSLLGLDISGGAPPKDETPTMMASADSGATKNVMGGSSIMGNYVMSSNSDRFAALDTLDIPIAASASWNAQEAENRLLGSGSSAPTSSKSLGDMGTPSLTVTDGSTTSDALPSSSGLSDMAFAIPSEPMTIPPISGGLKIAQSVPWSSGVDGAATEDYGNDDGFGMAMGGGMGAGLEPAAPAPGAPPPPPPPR